MENRITRAGSADARWNLLHEIGGFAALIIGGLFLVAIIKLAIVAHQPESVIGGLLTLQNNWLIEIFKVHAGFRSFQTDLLRGLNYPDIALLALVSITFLDLYADLRKISRIWSFIAMVQPFLGILLFIATQEAGRSSVIGAMLATSVIMLRNNISIRGTGYLGIVASLLLLAGDFSAGIIPPSTTNASLFGLGYVLMIIWFFLIARRLLQLRLTEEKA